MIRSDEVEPRREALLLESLARPGPLVSVELRPPRSGLGSQEGMSAWIDLHHALRRIVRDERFVFLTDNAVGAAEEENLAHVGANVGDDVDLRRIVPILTCKHALDYCTMFGSRAVSWGYDALTVLGGDETVGPPRCVPHAQDLRAILRERVPGLPLGGWANPHRDPVQQTDFLTAAAAHVDFALTQVVSHHALPQAAALLAEMERREVSVPLVFGVFYYRSANPRTMATLGGFFPVPAEAVTREFEAGATAEQICARSIRGLRDVGADKVYVSNLGNRGTVARLREILDRL